MARDLPPDKIKGYIDAHWEDILRQAEGDCPDHPSLPQGSKARLERVKENAKNIVFTRLEDLKGDWLFVIEMAYTYDLFNERCQDDRNFVLRRPESMGESRPAEEGGSKAPEVASGSLVIQRNVRLADMGVSEKGRESSEKGGASSSNEREKVGAIVPQGESTLPEKKSETVIPAGTSSSSKEPESELPPHTLKFQRFFTGHSKNS